MDDDLIPEYDFTQLPVVARGQGRKRSSSIQLEPDVVAIFPDSRAVNEGLRLLMRLIKQQPSEQGTKFVTASKPE